MAGRMKRGAEILRGDGVVGLARGIDRFFRWKLSKIARPIETKLSETQFQLAEQPCHLMDEDWDVAIILDGCRYDAFLQANTIDGDLQYRISPGSATPEFLISNFADKEYYDTVYVTANPMYRTLSLGSVFHEVIDVWKEHWDSKFRTVLPESIANATLTALESYPNKRIISHFVQPHYPFIGDLGQELPNHAGIELTYRRAVGTSARRDNRTVWELLRKGKVERNTVWKAYLENVRVALPHVEQITKADAGKTVVTSDHGNLFGEKIYPLRRMFGHPSNIKHENLCKIPWLVRSSKNRRDIISSTPSGHKSITNASVSNRLKDLGYADL